MFRWTYLQGALLFCAATLAVAQTPARPTDPVFVRAQTLVSDGNGVEGRALIDSVIAATPPTARLYPEALFWRASLASNAAAAESDYKHIVVDYPLAPQAEEALLRLAQLELSRGDREGALIHLQRISRDYPRSKSLARANYWTARVLFEKNDIPKACAANASALSQVGPTEIELRNQIQYQGQRCPYPVAAVAEAPRATADAPTSNPVVSTTASSTPTRTTASSTPASVTTSPTNVPASQVAASSTPASLPEKATIADTVAVTVSVPPKTVIPSERMKPPTEGRDTKPWVVDPAKSPAVAKPAVGTPAVAKPATKAPAVSGSGAYSVQVAAYKTKGEADKLVSSLTQRGYQARVDADGTWFRVRIGRYATAKDAEEALRQIKANQMTGFVVRAPER
jgi:tetratricopeptide (TPR) repeat protein